MLGVVGHGDTSEVVLPVSRVVVGTSSQHTEQCVVEPLHFAIALGVIEVLWLFPDTQGMAQFHCESRFNWWP